LRTSYDVFGLSLLAALIADRFGLDKPVPDGQKSGSDGER
jgi:hypothetical protein